MMGYPKPDYISYEKKQKWSICSHRWTVTLQHIIIRLTIHRSYLGKETKVPNSPHSRSVIPHCIITRGLYVVSFIIIISIICNYQLFLKYFSHYRGCYYCNFLYEHKLDNTEASKSIMSLSTIITSSTDLHDSLWPAFISPQYGEDIIWLPLKHTNTKYIPTIHS